MDQNGKRNCFFLLTMDCERVQKEDVYPFGPRSWRESEANIISFAETAAQYGYRVTFFAVPEATERHADVFKALIRSGHEVGLHLHPHTFRLGINEHLGNLPYAVQYRMMKSARDAFYHALGFPPSSFRSGYFSANQDTFRVLEALAFKRGSSIIPGRNLMQSGSIWGNWPRQCRYVNSYFEVPVTVQYVNKATFGLFCLQSVIRLILCRFFLAAARKTAYVISRTSSFRAGKDKYLLDLRIENCEYKTLRMMIVAELKRMKEEGIFPVVTVLTHSYVNYTACNHREHEYGRSRAGTLNRLLGYMNHQQVVMIKSRTLRELQHEYDGGAPGKEHMASRQDEIIR